MRAEPLSGVTGEPLWLLTAGDSAHVHDDRRYDQAGSGADELKHWALDQLPSALLVCDATLRVVAANNTAHELLGVAEGQLVGLGIAEVGRGRVVEGAEDVPALAEQAMREGRVVSHEAYVRTPGVSRERSWSTMLYPLRDPGGRVCGVAAVVSDTTRQYWSRRRLSVVNEASVRIGTTLDVARTAQELADVSISGFADFVTVDLLDAVLHGVDAAAVDVVGEAVFRRSAHASVVEGCPEATVEIGRRHVYAEGSPQGQALVTGRGTVHRFEGRQLPAWVGGDSGRVRSIRMHGIHSALVVPLRARGVTLGVAQFYRHRTSEPFDDDDLLLAREIANRAAVCVDNARRYTRERTTAVALQRSLLPGSMAQQRAVQVATRYLPAVTSAGVGGDWYDVIPLSGARVALVVGDVVGHGLRASAAMAQLRTAVRTLADVDLAPDELLTQLDDVVVRLGEEQMDPSRQAGAVEGGGPVAGESSATCLYAVYDPVSRRCSLASAGHVPPAVVTPDGRADILELPVGPPLGLGGLPFETAEFDLPEDSLLALYTDGLLATRDRDPDAGLDLLRQALSGPSRPLEELCDLLLESLQPQAAPADDIALLLARTRALDPAQVATWDLPADPAAVSRVRNQVAGQLLTWGLEDVRFATEVVVSELVTNAIRYGGKPIRLRLIRNATLTCEVSDASSTAPHLRRARIFDEGGRGLLLVAQLTNRWGTRQLPTGKIIWAEQPLPTH